MNLLKTLSIIIPVYNEEKTINQVLREVTQQELFGWHKHIIIVDDGSHDGTYDKIQRWAECINLGWEMTLICHSHNFGKGAAVRTGLDAAIGEAVMIQDADLEYHPQDIPSLLKELENPEVTAVYGSRFLKPVEKGYWHYIWGVKVLTMLTNLFFGCRLTDIYTGYKIFRLAEIRSLALQANGFEFEAEITARLLKQGAIIKEVPISYSPRYFQEGKKICARDGMIGMWTLFRIWIS